MGIEFDLYKEFITTHPDSFVQSSDLEIIFDEDVITQYTEENNRPIGVMYQSRFNTLIVDLVKDKDGKIFPYERLLPTATGQAVVAVPVVDGKFIMLRQFRHAIREQQFAFPRGFGENGLNGVENVTKELSEEVGACVTKHTYIGEISPDSGSLGVRAQVFLCEVADYDETIRTEQIKQILLLSKNEVYELIANGQINDGFTLAALTLLAASA